ncbi:hypothetical protein WJ94_02795 [Burkholderia ubonensis]|nr:hypothetical protein WJ94_02795 [Burkholderia ubonensis]KVR59253.1 hypothetical protein WK19_05575 [Burkholderia ubonensis]
MQKFLTRPWDVALLRKHIAEAFRQFERVDAMVPPPQGRTDTDAECADMRVPRAAYSSEMRRRAPPRARPRRRDTGFPTSGIEG